ncbi:MAG: hypothetical protein KAV01_04220 [Candidatus Lokiarchaeota archaeon]|nr:hypothetical protein [Candidatus Lokiarchaeota archaeon]
MSSLEFPLQENYVLKKKICVLGGVEDYKDEFQKELSSNALPIENKRNIGVNISKIDFSFKKNEKFEFLLWNIDCRQQRAYLRTIFYNGAEAIIILISETKVDQIIHYLNEIQARLPSVALVFCIILEQFTKEEIIYRHFKNEDFNSIIKSNNIQINEIFEPTDILDQICSTFLKKDKYKELDNSYIIDFIPLNLLFVHSDVSDDCNDYYEPETRNTKIIHQINTELLVDYILNLKLDVHFESANWLKIKNKNFGTFSIYLKNGNVYYFPKICEKCKDEKCLKVKKAPFFLCIEAGESTGWTNINGFDQIELLILTKILALKQGNEDNLPKSVLKQIKNINICEKIKK